MDQFIELSTQEVLNHLNKSNVKLIDVRSINAYNGWKLKNEARGGHIKGAKSLPEQWSTDVDWSFYVETKKILPRHQIIVYGYNSPQVLKIARLFSESGYENVSLYQRFIDEWAANPDLPMDSLPRYHHLIPAEWVKTIVDGGIPPEYNGARTVIVHAHYRNRDAYLSGHIPGAIDMDTLALEAPETWNRRSPDELKKALEAHGITADCTVILYGKYLDPDNDDEFPGRAAGHIGALRCAFIMMYAGVKDVRVLNGGFQSWQDAGYEIDFDDLPKKPIADFGVRIPANPEYAVDIPEAKEILNKDDAELVCVRSWEEFIGEVSGYNYINKKGRIPGAVFGNCGSDAYHMENYRNWDHTTREYHEIAQQWDEASLTPHKHLAFYCGTGWRGSEAWYNAWLMGWPRVSVFDGGWFEWSNDPNNPCDTGVPEESK